MACACWAWVLTQLGSLLAIWGLDKKKPEAVAAETQEGMSQEEGEIALMSFAARSSKNGAFSEGTIATRLTCCRVREGPRWWGANIPSLACLPSGRVLRGGIPACVGK